jgi:hypothetical protein
VTTPTQQSPTQADFAVGVENEQVALAVSDSEFFRWKAVGRVDKFTAEQEAEALVICAREGRSDLGEVLKENFTPYETIHTEGNLLTRLGRKRIMDRLVGTASNQALDNTHLRIGTGNSATAAVDTDTDLGAAAGSANRQFQMADSAATVGTGASSGQITVVSTFGTGVGNYAWQEWGLDGGTAAGTTVTADTNTTPGLVNHKITSLGTKTSAASWVFTITITVT